MTSLLEVSLLATPLMSIRGLGTVEESPSGGTVILEDTFTEAGTVDLDIHIPETGGPWVRNDDWCSSGTVKLQCTSNGWVQKSISNAAGAYDLGVVGADLDIIMSVRIGHNLQGGAEVFFRATLGAITECYLFGIHTGDRFGIRHYDGGYNTIYLSPTIYTVDQTYDFRCKVVGDAFTVWEVDILD